MIKFRQKTYSTLKMKLVRGVKKAVNKVDTAIINGSLKVQEKTGLIDGRLIPSSSSIKKVSPKSNRQINRETVKEVKEAQEFKRKVLEDPVNMNIDRGIKYSIENPIQTLGTPSPIPGTRLITTPTEMALKKKFPVYKNATERLGNSYHNSRVSRGIRKRTLPSLNNLAINASNFIPA